MKCKRSLIPLFVAVSLVFLLAACSSAPKPAKSAPKPAAEATKAEEPKAIETPPVVKEAVSQDIQIQPEKAEELEKDASALLEDAFAAYEEAQAALEQENMERALAKLDEAYGYLLKILF